MQVIEQSIQAKSNQEKTEDGLVVTDDFIAVIDGSTSKTKKHIHPLYTNGRYAMLLISKYIRNMKKDTSVDQFCSGITEYIHSHYSLIPFSKTELPPEERPTASAVIFSRLRREVWMIGDCQALIGETLYQNPKPDEAILAQQRADYMHRHPGEEGRPQILSALIQSMQKQNIDYSVIDGTPIPRRHVKVIELDFQPWTIVLASDGYPFLEPTLEESEKRLAEQLARDPLCIDTFKATKPLMTGNISFDDRTYIRFNA
jgi:hypothetical protein